MHHDQIFKKNIDLSINNSHIRRNKDNGFTSTLQPIYPPSKDLNNYLLNVEIFLWYIYLCLQQNHKCHCKGLS